MKTAGIVETLEIAKHDEKGRRLADAGEKETLIAAYQASGMTQRGFAQKEGINPFTFATWLRKWRMDGAKRSVAAPQRFLELGLPRAAGFGLEVVLADGLVIRGSDCRQMLALARGLRR
jgi:hypothetical protein